MCKGQPRGQPCLQRDVVTSSTQGHTAPAALTCCSCRCWLVSTRRPSSASFAARWRLWSCAARRGCQAPAHASVDVVTSILGRLRPSACSRRGWPAPPAAAAASTPLCCSCVGECCSQHHARIQCRCSKRTALVHSGLLIEFSCRCGATNPCLLFYLIDNAAALAGRAPLHFDPAAHCEPIQC